jgi:deoxyhypusine synthase
VNDYHYLILELPTALDKAVFDILNQSDLIHLISGPDILDLKKTQNLFDLVQAFQNTSFQSRNVFKCFEVYREMLSDPTCVIFLGLSGAMIPGGMRRVIHDMIEMKLVDVIVSTGANIFHDLFESFGYGRSIQPLHLGLPIRFPEQAERLRLIHATQELRCVCSMFASKKPLHRCQAPASSRNREVACP